MRAVFFNVPVLGSFGISGLAISAFASVAIGAVIGATLGMLIGEKLTANWTA